MIVAGLVLTFAIGVLFVAREVVPEERAQRLGPVLAVALVAFTVLVAVRVLVLAT